MSPAVESAAMAASTAPGAIPGAASTTPAAEMAAAEPTAVAPHAPGPAAAAAPLLSLGDLVAVQTDAVVDGVAVNLDRTSL